MHSSCSDLTENSVNCVDGCFVSLYEHVRTSPRPQLKFSICFYSPEINSWHVTLTFSSLYLETWTVRCYQLIDECDGITGMGGTVSVTPAHLINPS